MEVKNFDYVFGLLMTDGTVSSIDQKARVVLELKYDDRDIVYKLADCVPGSTVRERTRDTNFKEGYHSIIFSNCHKEFRELLYSCGYPLVDKAESESAPYFDYNKRDFWRGVIDGDGSIGITGDGRPFVSLVTVSDILHYEFTTFLREELGIITVVNRNKRDNAYVFSLFNENAVKFCDYIYKDATIYMDRKYEAYKKFSTLENIPKSSGRRPWTEYEDACILSNYVEDAAIMLGRSEQSVEMRLMRLTQKASSE